MTREEIEIRIKVVQDQLSKETHPSGLAMLNRTMEKLIMMEASDEAPRLPECLFRLRLRHDHRFRVGVTAFGMSAGAVVSVKQIDHGNDKALVDFGGGLVDWVGRQAISRDFDKVLEDA